jgi:diaminopimelate epimerase
VECPAQPASCDEYGLTYVKGHGTRNDFVILPDPAGELDLTPRLVRALCDRRAGIGADGVLRVVRTRAAGPQVAERAAGAEWFMDYRNADGSVASMCGNGIRVFVAFCARAGWIASHAGDPVPVATRGGVRLVRLVGDGRLTVDMGPAVVGGEPAPVTVTAGHATGPATVVHMPNPHAVTFVDTLDTPGPLTSPPAVHPSEAFPDGANVEFVVVAGVGQVAMRVHERGVGETLSCGTGACAAAVAARRRAGLGPTDDAQRDWQVDTRGGRLTVRERADGHVELTGPAELVATGHVSAKWVREHS